MDERLKLEKLDLLKQRFNVSYAKASEALEACDWDSVRAMVWLENGLEAAAKAGAESEKSNGVWEEIKVTGSDLVDTIKRLLHQGNINRIVVKENGGKELFNLPVNGLIAVTVLLPVLTAIGAVVVVAMDYTVLVERKA